VQELKHDSNLLILKTATERSFESQLQQVLILTPRILPEVLQDSILEVVVTKQLDHKWLLRAGA